ncbi:MAG: hypothetical protein M0R34_00365 [Candidatus Marinimicrobia bacterium]|jgi:hypothetical protein|nr:hypothetical protein [Candidatus Neomarinimicrobiota bacterium]
MNDSVKQAIEKLEQISSNERLYMADQKRLSEALALLKQEQPPSDSEQGEFTKRVRAELFYKRELEGFVSPFNKDLIQACDIIDHLTEEITETKRKDDLYIKHLESHYKGAKHLVGKYQDILKPLCSLLGVNDIFLCSGSNCVLDKAKEEIVCKIQCQQQRIQQLEAENEGLRKSCFQAGDITGRLQEENKKLQAELAEFRAYNEGDNAIVVIE